MREKGKLFLQGLRVGDEFRDLGGTLGDLTREGEDLGLSCGERGGDGGEGGGVGCGEGGGDGCEG